jgi:hypothetical protein
LTHFDLRQQPMQVAERQDEQLDAIATDASTMPCDWRSLRMPSSQAVGLSTGTMRERSSPGLSPTRIASTKILT